ncbi:MAG: PEGA domain-containing protein [Myxococcota bacterium]
MQLFHHVFEGAEELIDEGFALHSNYKFEQAARKYQEALEHWDHPEIHFALGKIFRDLVKPLESHASFVRAVEHGPGSLRPRDYQLAAASIERLRAQLAEIAVRSDQAGAEVRLNGQPWFAGPGHERRLIMPGQYLVEVSKTGYVTDVVTVTVFAGKRAELTPTLVSLADSNATVRRWRPWKLWTVVGTSAATAVLGGVLRQRAVSDTERYDDQITEACPPPDGCAPAVDGTLPYDDLKRGATWSNRIGLSMVVAGGLGMVTGLALVYFNRPRRLPADQLIRKRISALPLIAPDAVGVTAGFAF